MPMSLLVSNKIRNMGFVCAMLVVFIHVGKPSIVGSGGWWLYQLTADGLSRIAVPFFSLCSGFFLAKHFTDNGWWVVAVRKRIWTLCVPYLLWSLLFYAFMSVLYFISPDNPACWRIRPNASLFQKVLLATGLSFEKLPLLYPLWYVRFLFLLVFLSPIFAVIARHSKTTLITVTGILYLVFNPGDGSPIGVHIGVPFEALFYFCCGLLIVDENIRSKIKLLFSTWAGFVALILIILRAVLLYKGFQEVYLLKPVYIFLGIIGMWYIIPSRVWSPRIVALSFLVYVTHLFGLNLYNFVFKCGGSDDVLLLTGRICFDLVFAFVVSYFLKNIIGRRVAMLWGGRK